ncbi:UTP--GlnB (protein PII) uridylyltransferase, GlnD [Haloechinothrix alba]|uniref:UTP--GlnB (Protein PII) uridylyltransferase, GlnD n=1 Tax=Haloechinothrix alba TaxID=664784 RepID=A0A238YP93_9PSEU|nr:[protein-PII] uridylyltransferase [Haloechinothrix alba]SNR72840.1 UTP--GlnB (protein PII) uridylyltransferase, GlnD [Haloechinothrix alba]
MSASELLVATDRLLSGGYGGEPHGRPGAAALRAGLVDLYEFWLSHHATAAGVGIGNSDVALVAVGGLGRRELVPFSDLDLVLVHDGGRGAASIAEIADELWYPLWDAGLGLDHSVRTPGEALAVANNDLRTALGLLDTRLIAGDAGLAERLARSARQQWQRTARVRVGELADGVRHRWHTVGEIGGVTEPDLKHAGGGLRDIALLDALAAAQLVDRCGDEVHAARSLLLDVRTELRRELRRDRDVLAAEHAATIARTLGFADRFALARELSAGGRAVRYALDVALRSSARAARRPRGFRVRRTPLAEGVVLHDGEVALAKGADPRGDEGLSLRVGVAAARGRYPISQGTLRVLADSAPEPRAPWPSAMRSDLASLLGSGEGVHDAVEALDRAGLWGRLFPEWGAIRDLQPAEPVHSWSVDRHLLATCVAAASLSTTVSRPDLLMLGALLHDIGKGRSRDHSVLGADIAARIGHRIGLDPADRDRVAGMVRHHLLLPHTALRRDISEPATVHRVVRTIGSDPELLELLHALAHADARATTAGAWSTWKARLLADLASRCRQVMAGKRLTRPEPLDEGQRALAAEAARSGDAGVRVSTDDAVVTVVAAAARGAEVLVPVTGALAVHSLKVHAAAVHWHAGIPVGVFTASPRFGTPPDTTFLREQVVRALHGTLPIAERLAGKERDYPEPSGARPGVRVQWFDEDLPRQGAALLELRATDRIGLLHRIACALRAAGAEVGWLRAETYGAWSVDSFALRRRDGAPDHQWRLRVEREVHAALREGRDA